MAHRTPMEPHPPHHLSIDHEHDSDHSDRRKDRHDDHLHQAMDAHHEGGRGHSSPHEPINDRIASHYLIDDEELPVDGEHHHHADHHHDHHDFLDQHDYADHHELSGGHHHSDNDDHQMFQERKPIDLRSDRRSREYRSGGARGGGRNRAEPPIEDTGRVNNEHEEESAPAPPSRRDAGWNRPAPNSDEEDIDEEHHYEGQHHHFYENPLSAKFDLHEGGSASSNPREQIGSKRGGASSSNGEGAAANEASHWWDFLSLHKHQVPTTSMAPLEFHRNNFGYDNEHESHHIDTFGHGAPHHHDGPVAVLRDSAALPSPTHGHRIERGGAPPPLYHPDGESRWYPGLHDFSGPDDYHFARHSGDSGDKRLSSGFHPYAHVVGWEGPDRHHGVPGEVIRSNAHHFMSSEERQGFLNYGLLVLLMLVLSSIVTGHLTSRYIHKGINVPVIAVLLGFIAASLLWLGGIADEVVLERVTSFNENVFFVFILPPIIFASGFELTGKRGRIFFSRFGTILWFAIFATAVAFAMNTLGFYFSGVANFSVPFSIGQAMALGALLSPTDPVTVLSLFRETAVNPVIETVVLGESLLNDAVAILLYRMIIRHPTSMTAASELMWFGYMFALSMLIGLGVGLCISLVVKIASLRWSVSHEERVTGIETAIILVAPWFSYLIAETFNLSGVVAVLFCGIAIARYAIPNFSQGGTTVAKNVYASVSQLAETVAFVLLGISAFTIRALWSPVAIVAAHGESHHDWHEMIKSAMVGRVIFLHFFTVVFVSLGRVVSIALTAGIVNMLLRTAEGGRLPQRIQWIVSLSGLRGAVAVALALKANSDIGGFVGSVIVSTTLVYALFTILIVGPCLPAAFSALGIEDAPQTPQSIGAYRIKELPDRSAKHIMLWQYMVQGLRRLDGWVYAFVTARGNDGEFIGDSMMLWRGSSEDEFSDLDNASTPTTIVISDS